MTPKRVDTKTGPDGKLVYASAEEDAHHDDVQRDKSTPADGARSMLLREWGLDPVCNCIVCQLARMKRGLPKNVSSEAHAKEIIQAIDARDEAAAKDRADTLRTFPPPSECERCGESSWVLQSVSPNRKSAKYACGFCRKTAIVRADQVAAQLANRGREPIPKEVQREVWRRDQGKCVRCGSQENLEFDHVIAVSLGGATTARNLQLLCEKCNRKKSGKEPGSE